jgi:hypothetical protein
MRQAEIGRNSVVGWSGGAVATEVNGEVVLMNLARDQCHGLGETGSEIWRKLREPIQVAELVAELEAEFDAAPGEIESDVLRTLGEFAAEGLIQIRAGNE